MNFCKECRKPFALKDNPDYCNSCRILFGINSVEEIWGEEEDISFLMRKYMIHGI